MPYKNKEDEREWRRQYYKDHREKEKKRKKRYRENHPEKMRARHLRCKYGLSHEDWLEMWENQNGKCKLCGSKFTRPSDTYVDHNHKTGEIRGLLCPKCNTGLGQFNDDVRLMAKAIEYLLGDK